MTDLEERTCRIVTDVFGLPEGAVRAATSADDVPGWDSVNVVNLVMAVEAEFGVSITPDEAADFLSVSLIVAVLREKGLEG